MKRIGDDDAAAAVVVFKGYADAVLRQSWCERKKMSSIGSRKLFCVPGVEYCLHYEFFMFSVVVEAVRDQ